MPNEYERLHAMQKAWAREISNNIGLGIVWSDEYRALMNQTADIRMPLEGRIRLYDALWAREVVLGAEKRIAATLAEIALMQKRKVEEDARALEEVLEYL